jgi:DNA-binding MarR family transcriptional regulator
MDYKEAENFLEKISPIIEEDHRLKFARIDLDDFDSPVFKKLNWNERIVYWVLYFRSNDSGQETWVTNRFIAGDARMKYETVKDIIPRLEEKHIIKTRISDKSGRRVIKCLVKIRKGM